MSKTDGLAGHDVYVGEAMSPRQFIECIARQARYARLAESRTAWAWGPMRTEPR